MSPRSNDSLAFSVPNLSTFSKSETVLDLTAKRNIMDTTLSSFVSSPSISFSAPAPLSVLGGSDDDFSKALLALKAELAPVGLVESLLVDRVLLAVSRLRSLINGFDPMGDDLARAEQSIDQALEALNASRAARSAGWGHATPTSSKVGDLSNLAPLPMASGPIHAEAPAATSPAPDDEFPWRERLIFDENVSDESPVVRGTWVTAGQVVSLIVDGANWDDILRNYPELTRRDIRACLAYTVEQDGPIAF